MRNILAVLIALCVFAATVVFINAQGASAGSGFSFDIREAAEGLAGLLAQFISSLVGGGFVLPWLGSLVLGAFGLSLPALFAFTLLGSSGR